MGNEEYLMWLRCCNALCQKVIAREIVLCDFNGNIEQLFYVEHEDNKTNELV